MPDQNEKMTVKQTGLAYNRARTTISTWVHNGVMNRHTKKRVYLRHEYFGGQILITRADVSEFLAALNRTTETTGEPECPQPN